MSLLIANPWIITMNEENAILRNGYALVEGDRIVEVGNSPERLRALRVTSDEIIEAGDKILLPGMVNAHTHLFQTFMRGLADDKPLFQWLSEEIWPFSALMSEEDFYYAALIGCIENLKTGATGVLDQHYIYTSVYNGDRVLEAMRDSGIRGSLCRCFANIEYHKTFRESDDVIVDEIKRLNSQWGGQFDGRLCVSVGPINPWAVSAELLVRTKALSKELGLKYQVHTAETKAVVERTAALNGGLRNVEYFDKLDILDEDTQMAHSVWLDDGELEIIERKKPLVVHCPVANMYLASGVARIPEMLQKGTRVALATDGPGSNNSQDMLSTLKFAACLHKISTLNAQAISTRDILSMATRNGAYVLGRDDIGVIAAGKKADMILVDWQKPHIAPVHKPDSALVYNANGNDVDTVIVDGQIVVRNKKSTLVDEKALAEECQGRIEFIKSKMAR
ncbi:MAG: amidohydrolase [Bacillota bacterium]